MEKRRKGKLRLTRDRSNISSEHLEKIDLLLTLQSPKERRKGQSELMKGVRERRTNLVVRHVNDTIVSLRSTNMSESNPSVSSGSFHDGSSRFDET